MKPFLYADIETLPSQDVALIVDIQAKHAVAPFDPAAVKAAGNLKDPAKVKRLKRHTDEEYAQLVQDVIDENAADLAERIAKAQDEHQAAVVKAAADADAEYRKTSLSGATGHIASVAWAWDNHEVLTIHNWALDPQMKGYTKLGSLDAVLEGERQLLTNFFAEMDEGVTEEAREFVGQRYDLSVQDFHHTQTREEFIAARMPAAGEFLNNFIPVIVAHYADFDVRFLWQRAVALGVPVPSWWPVNASKYKDDQVVDTMTMWAGHGNRISLDALCRALDIPGKDGFDGSMVWDAVREGRIAEVVEYNRDDVERLRSVHRRMCGKPVEFDVTQVFTNEGGGVRVADVLTPFAADIDAGFQAVKDLCAAEGIPTDLLVNHANDTPGWTFTSDDFPMEWSTNHPVESGEHDDATEIEACTWGEWKRDCEAELERQRADKAVLEAFVRDTVDSLPLDFANATDARGNPAGWEE